MLLVSINNKLTYLISSLHDSPEELINGILFLLTDFKECDIKLFAENGDAVSMYNEEEEKEDDDELSGNRKLFSRKRKHNVTSSKHGTAKASESKKESYQKSGRTKTVMCAGTSSSRKRIPLQDINANQRNDDDDTVVVMQMGDDSEEEKEERKLRKLAMWEAARNKQLYLSEETLSQLGSMSSLARLQFCR